MDIQTTLIVVGLLLLCSAFFSGSETALMALSRPKLHALSEQGNKLAKLLEKMLDNPDRLLSSILLGNNLVNIGASALATGLMLALFGDAGIVYATVAMTFLVLLFSEILPKTIAARHPYTFANVVGRPLALILWVLTPATTFLGILSRILMRCIGINPQQQVLLDEDDLRGALGLGLKQDVLERTEHRMLDSIFELDDLTVEDVMVHRSSMEMLDVATPITNLLEQLAETPYSRLPVWEDNPDNIIGILHIKDFYKHYARTLDPEKMDVKLLMQPPYFVPETTTIGKQLHEFKEQRRHLALVVDEYGDIQGLLSLEDILEEIVGDIHDEHDHIRHDIVATKDGGYVISGHVAIRDINRELEWNLPDEDAVTLAGLIVEEAGEIPLSKQTLNIAGYSCQILAKKGQAIVRIRVTPPQPTPQAEVK